MKAKTSSKIFLVLSLIMLSSDVLFSQWKKGDWLAEGSIGNLQFSTGQLNAGSFKNKNQSTYLGFDLRPSLGYFVSQNLMVGATLGFTYVGQKNYDFYSDGTMEQQSLYRNASLSLIPTIRYYFKTESVKNKFYAQLAAGGGMGVLYKQEHTEYYLSGAVSDYYKGTYPKVPTIFYAQAFLGFNHFLTTNVALNSALGCNYAGSNNTIFVSGSNSSGSYQTQASSSTILFWSLGFTMIIPGKKNKLSQ